MRKLFFLTQLSDLVITHAIENPYALFVTPIKEIHERLNDVGIDNWHIPSFHHDKSDKLFYETYMPGVLDDIDMSGFPMWKSLAIDRFRFWYTPSQLPDIIYELDYDELVIPIDMYNNLPWTLARDAASVTGIKTHPLRTREFYAFYPYTNLDNVIVSFNDEKELLESLCPEISVTVGAGERPKRKPVESQKRESLRNGLQIPKDAYLTAVIFDKRDEWQFRRLSQGIINDGRPVNLVVFPYDERSRELFYKCVPTSLRQQLSMKLMDDYQLIDMCDELITFRFLEDIYPHMPDITWAIYDWFNLNYSNELALKGMKVFT